MARLQRQELNRDDLTHDVESWWGVKFQSKLIARKLDEGKNALLKIVQRHGEADPETGSLFLELDEPVSDRKIVMLKAQRTVRTGLNPDAERILRQKGIWDDCVEMVPQVDEGKVHAAYYDRKLSDEDLQLLFPKTIFYSLILLDDADKPVN